MTLNERISVREILRHTDHRPVYRSVAVGVIPSENVTDGRRGFAERLVVRQPVLEHRVHNAPLSRFHSVARVRKGARNDNGHGVLEEGFFYLPLHIHRYDLLIREFDRSVVSLMIIKCHFYLPNQI